jgi:energy-coupling factor transporter transmembrane protein EcfT
MLCRLYRAATKLLEGCSAKLRFFSILVWTAVMILIAHRFVSELIEDVRKMRAALRREYPYLTE